MWVANPWWPAQNIVGVSYVEADHYAFGLAPCNLLLNDEGRGSKPHANFGDVGTGTSLFSGTITQFHRAPTHSDAPAIRNAQDLAGLLECAWKRAPKITHQLFLPRLPSRSNSSSCAPGFSRCKAKIIPFFPL